MKMKVFIVASIILSSYTGIAQANDDTNQPIPDLCFFSGAPPSDIGYTAIKQIKRGKQTYGSVVDVLPPFAEDARKLGADAIINYTGSQRFGFWPWRVTRPVVRGLAIKWTGAPKPDCTAIGGTLMSKIIATNTPPAR